MKPSTHSDYVVARANMFKRENQREEAERIARRVDGLTENAKTHGDDEWIAARMTSILTDRRWLTKAGNYVYPEDMGTQHIVNTIAMVMQGRTKRPGCSGRSNAEWLEIFHEELKRRGFKNDGTKVPL